LDSVPDVVVCYRDGGPLGPTQSPEGAVPLGYPVRAAASDHGNVKAPSGKTNSVLKSSIIRTVRRFAVGMHASAGTHDTLLQWVAMQLSYQVPQSPEMIIRCVVPYGH